jgi:Rieske Fe-S protein
VILVPADPNRKDTSMSTDQHDPTPSAGVSRRDTLRVAGVAGAAAVGAAGLAACGSEDTGAVGTAVTSAASGAADAIQAADVPVGGGVILENVEVVVTQPTEGDFKAFSAVCTHQGCIVGDVTDGRITCPCHGSQFDAETGEVLQGPATQPLPEKSVTLDGDGLRVS